MNTCLTCGSKLPVGTKWYCNQQCVLTEIRRQESILATMLGKLKRERVNA